MADRDRIIDHDRPLHDRFGGEDGGLWLVDDGLARDRAGGAGVVERERPALHVVRLQLLGACAVDEVVDGPHQVREAELVRVLDDRDDQAVRD